MIENDPFAVLTAVVAPAILTNACSVLAQGTSNRIARVVDRSRVVMAMERRGPEDTFPQRQLDSLRIRARLLLNALRLFYAALAMFAATAIIAIVGSLLVTVHYTGAFHAAAILGLLIGSAGVLGIVAGCALMVSETHLAIRTLTDEHSAFLPKRPG